jgi:FkbM family methyltransferase
VPGEGHTVRLARWRAEVETALHNADADRESRRRAELVSSDVGPILFPAWDAVIRPAIAADGGWEGIEADWLAHNCREGSTALVIGANVGYHAIRIARLIGPNGHVIALEPEPFNFELLQMNLLIAGVTNVTAIQSAAGERDAVVDLTQSADNSADHRSFRRRDAPAERVIQVPMIRIDSLITRDNVDTMLIDTQSYDHRVIAGSKNLIARCHPRMLVEFWPTGLAELGDDPVAVIDGYRALGYEVSICGEPDFRLDASAAELVEHARSNPVEYVSLILQSTRQE